MSRSVKRLVVPPVRLLHVSTVQAGNTDGGGEDTLWTWDLPANTLSRDGQAIRVTVYGTTAANGNTKTGKLYFGGNLVRTFLSGAVNNGTWMVRAVIIRKGAASEDLLIRSAVDTSSSVLWAASVVITTAAITLHVTGESAASASDDVVFRGAIVELLN